MVFIFALLYIAIATILRIEEYGAKRLLSLLEWFIPIPHELVPDNSLLREFLGRSILKDFKVWKNG